MAVNATYPHLAQPVRIYQPMLSGADLRGADLRGADLSSANLSGANMSILQTDIWTCYIQPDHIRIGCQYHTVNEWIAFTEDQISAMDSRALVWWRKWKPAILAIHATFQ